MIIKSLRAVITTTTNLFAKSNRKKVHCHTTKMVIKTFNNAGRVSNALRTCSLIGDGLSFTLRAVLIMSYFTVSIMVTMLNIAEVLVAILRGIHYTITKLLSSLKPTTLTATILDLKYC